jgi:hypothetical protein
MLRTAFWVCAASLPELAALALFAAAVMVAAVVLA